MHRATAMRQYRWQPIRDQVQSWYERQRLAILELPALEIDVMFGATNPVPRVSTLLIKLRYESRVEFVLVIVPAKTRANLTAIRKMFGASTAWLSTMGEVRSLTQSMPGCVPAFGSLLGVPVVLDAQLSRGAVMFAPSGRPGHAVCVPVNEFMLVERPRLIDFAREDRDEEDSAVRLRSA